MPRTNKSGRGAELICSEEVEFEQFMKLMMNHLEQTRTEEKESAVIRRTEASGQLNVQDRAEFRAVAGRPALSLSAKVSGNQSSSPRHNREIQNTEKSFLVLCNPTKYAKDGQN